MTRTSSIELHLRAVEDDIRFGERLVGRIAALTAGGPARGKGQRAQEVRRMLAAAEDALAPLYAIRGRLRHDLGSSA